MEPLSELSADPAFQRAFLAVSYFAGARAERLHDALPALTPEARALTGELAAGERTARARALARELERIARRLDAMRLR